MLQMYYLRTNVLSKQKEEFVETAMAFACDIHELHNAAPRAVLTVRSILSAGQRNQCRELLLSAERKAQLSSKLWSRKRRRKLTAAVDNGRASQLLFQLKFQQHHRSARPRHASVVPRAHESAEERQPAGNAVSGDWRRWLRKAARPLPADRLRARTASSDLRRRAAGHRLSTVALERSLRSQRDPKGTKVSQRERPDLCVLQSSSLESLMSARYAHHMTNKTSVKLSPSCRHPIRNRTESTLDNVFLIGSRWNVCLSNCR